MFLFCLSLGIYISFLANCMFFGILCPLWYCSVSFFSCALKKDMWARHYFHDYYTSLDSEKSQSSYQMFPD